MLQNVLTEQFCLILNQFVYVGDVSGDTSPIIWQRVMVGQQILCNSVGPVWKQCLLVIGCLFLHLDWMMCFNSDPLLSLVQETRCVKE